MKIVLFLLAMIFSAVSYVVHLLGLDFAFGLGTYTLCVFAWMLWGWR